jgi:mono/diheme cytochrome c family protein/uncharacterized membrane protein
MGSPLKDLRERVAAVLFLMSLGGSQLSAPPEVHAQADSSKVQKDSAPRPSAPKATETHVRALFEKHCAKCHGKDGTGSAARDGLPKIPNFIDVSWQKKSKDAQLVTSILEGKGEDMPSWGAKISEEQARSLVGHVRAFAPTKGKSGQEGKAEREGKSGRGGKDESVLADFDQSYQRLEKKSQELKKQYHELADSPSDTSSRSSPGKAKSSPGEANGAPARTSAGTPAVRALFVKHCAKCHGKDGTGSEERDGLPKIPNFTDVSWQEKSKDAQLVASILDGKGTKGEEMPSWRGKISEEQARSLVGYVRAFAPTKGTSEGGSQTDHSARYRKSEEEPEDPAPAEAAEAQPPRGFFEKAILWLGKFHPATVHFPIALLTAAAVALLVRMVGGERFDVVARYCLWFGFLTAVPAGVLGWCAGGFHLTDPSWIQMTHRWLGTSTVACAGLVLVLSEVSKRPDRHRTRVWFRVMLVVAAVLVMATGFFGGAIVFGLDHYGWPR